MSAALILPSSSFGLFGMQVQHQTSTHAGNILSSYGNPCKLKPLSNCVLRASAYQRTRQRKMGIAKKLTKAFEAYLIKEGCLEDPFSKQIFRNYQPCVSTPRTPEQHKECVNQKNTVYLNSCPIFYPAT